MWNIPFWEWNGGGDGGNGGWAGSGGNGGTGGKGGNGASGVFVDVVTDDVRLLCGLLMHTKGGLKGGSGSRGDKGREGQGGRGGVAAHGGRGMRPGKSGQPGKNGKAGKAGTGNETGDFGGTGQVRYVVVEKGEGDVRNRNIIDCGLIPPQGQVCRWNARIVDDDGILEPGEELYLENFEIFNDGKDRPMLTLPSNSDIRMTFPNGGMELLDPNALHYINEPIEPGDRREVNTKIGLKVPVPPAPTKPGSYVSFPEMVGQVGMLCWESSSTYSEVLKVRWPVVLSDMECPPQLSRGEKEMLKFSVKNLSHKDIEKGLLCYRVVLKTPGFFIPLLISLLLDFLLNFYFNTFKA